MNFRSDRRKFELALLFLALSAATALNRTPLCDTCRCFNRTLENPDVDCNGIAVDRENSSFWSANGTLYQINSLNMQNNNLTEIETPFPNATYVHLDLSRNFLRTIDVYVFRNLFKLETLILSYNNLETLSPDVFMVPPPRLRSRHK